LGEYWLSCLLLQLDECFKLLEAALRTITAHAYHLSILLIESLARLASLIVFVSSIALYQRFLILRQTRQHLILTKRIASHLLALSVDILLH